MTFIGTLRCSSGCGDRAFWMQHRVKNAGLHPGPPFARAASWTRQVSVRDARYPVTQENYDEIPQKPMSPSRNTRHTHICSRPRQSLNVVNVAGTTCGRSEAAPYHRDRELLDVLMGTARNRRPVSPPGTQRTSAVCLDLCQPIGIALVGKATPLPRTGVPRSAAPGADDHHATRGPEEELGHSPPC